jgi:hypothetical protein
MSDESPRLPASFALIVQQEPQLFGPVPKYTVVVRNGELPKEAVLTVVRGWPQSEESKYAARFNE